MLYVVTLFGFLIVPCFTIFTEVLHDGESRKHPRKHATMQCVQFGLVVEIIYEQIWVDILPFVFHVWDPAKIWIWLARSKNEVLWFGFTSWLRIGITLYWHSWFGLQAICSISSSDLFPIWKEDLEKGASTLLPSHFLISDLFAEKMWGKKAKEGEEEQTLPEADEHGASLNWEHSQLPTTTNTCRCSSYFSYLHHFVLLWHIY